jgi:hypothetical protein
MGNTIPPSLHGVAIAGTTAQRPANAPHGALYYNFTTGQLEVRDENAEAWKNAMGMPVASDVVFLASNGAPTDGTSGTGAGVAGPGSLCSDYLNAKLYINSNTKASPLWSVVGAQTT